jgi:hypothetical protein
MAASRKIKRPVALPAFGWLEREPPTPLGGQDGAAGVFSAVEGHESPVSRAGLKKQRAWAQRAGSAQDTTPSGVPGPAAMFGCFSHQAGAST